MVPSDSTKGLNARLDERRGIAWNLNSNSGHAARSGPRLSEREIQVCAQCHARRSQIADGYEAGKPFFDYYRPALLGRGLYHADGQQRDEVYTWGSFLQSRMYAQGVTCSDCHNPHSGKLRAQGNAVCGSCHQPATYDAPAHHHHESSSAGATCTGCHMPPTNYMMVDPRHDHSLRVPRPDLSVKLGTPNACTGCHTTRTARWAAARVRAWYGHEPAPGRYARMAAAFAAAESRAFDAQALLRELASDAEQPDITRATALAELDPTGNAVALVALNDGLHDPNPLVRLGALQSVARLPLELRLRLAEPLLSDPLKAIRIEAAGLLGAVSTQQFSPARLAAFQRAADEFIETQRYNADRAEARVSVGTFLAERGERAGAEAELRAAIALEPDLIPAYVNLADVYRVQGRDADGERVLRDGLARAPGNASLHYALGLALARSSRRDSALSEFARADALEPGNARFAYVLAVALHSSGQVDAAIAKLETALTTHPANRDILSALVSFHRTRGERAQAERYAAQLRLLSRAR
jgi:Flp pilus assembly protein TadD